MLAVFVAGIGASIGIISGETMFRLLPYYILAIVGLYIYFSIAALVDIPGRRETLKINLMDHLENHLLSRLKNNLPIDGNSPEKASPLRKEPAVREKIVPIQSKVIPDMEPEAHPAGAQYSEDEIEELLQELII
jgi:hypothetical protein